jgi:ribonuclease BN (tRNA processing enzyme)
VSAKITFYPLGNADTALIRLADSRLILVDFANMRNPSDKDDNRCDLPAELRRALADAGKKDFAAVCFTHLDADHVKGMKDFFWLDYLISSQVDGRPKIGELWVPASAITETGVEDDAWSVRQEARYRLKNGSGIKVFSRPEALKAFLEENKLTVEDRKDCIVDAGQAVPGFSVDGSEAAEFFVHCPFAWRTNERGLEDRNQDSIVFQATFRESGEDTYVLFGSDVESETISQIVATTKRHNREARLLWDVLKLFHHCSYKSLDKDNKGEDETVPIPDAKWLIEDQGRDSCIIVSPSKPIPKKGTKEDDDPQPPHRQAAAYYRRVIKEKDGEFRVTMEHPSQHAPKPFSIEITRSGARMVTAIATAIGTATSTSSRAG